MKQKIQTLSWPVIGLAFMAACATYLLAVTGGGVKLKVETGADGITAVAFEGVAGQTYRVESSDDLATWAAVSPDLSGTGGVTEWRDLRGGTAGARFYRVVTVSALRSGSGTTRPRVR